MAYEAGLHIRSPCFGAICVFQEQLKERIVMTSTEISPLVSCIVSPAFHFDDFKLVEK
ncbi:hypothetical protein [Paenibacillus donghaensis]|uniref:hypothetical protein n=1 Tax=Paenibacillus donghaensis TaxID=414771 RepID=UPI0012FD80FD|nr:hypothetical protein [Paenibacillus donghaensis]